MKAYLACPYSHHFFLVRWWRWLLVTRCAAKLMVDGHIVFSPISHTFFISFFLPRKIKKNPDALFKLYMKQDLPLVDWADVLVVVDWGGGSYYKSRGVGAEAGRAYQGFKHIVRCRYYQIMNGQYERMMARRAYNNG